MEAEIKNRIEQIRQGKVPAEYQKTPAGILPKSWKVTTLCNVLKKKNAKNKGRKYDRILTNSATKGIVPQTDYFDKQIANDENTEGYYVVEKGNFVYNPRISVSAPCGPFNKYYGNETGIMSPLYSVYQFVDEKVHYSEFLAQYFLSAYWYRYMNGIANYGARSDRMNVTQDMMDLMPLPYPPESEYKKIVRILLNQDRVVALREKLLAEKLRQKQYLMQVLLTGKKRLPGYKGKWKTIRFGEVFSFGSTNSFSRQFMVSDGDGIHNIHYGDILTKYGEILDARITKLPVLMKEAGEKIKDFISDGDIVIADTAEDLTAGKVIEVQNVGTQKIAAGMHTMWCTPKRGYFAPGWLGFYMNSMHFHRQLIPYMAGIKVMAISKTNIVKTHLLVPSIDEQCAIVTILTCADREIELLKKGLEQERRKKKALMQLLLSGIVRVKP